MNVNRVNQLTTDGTLKSKQMKTMLRTQNVTRPKQRSNPSQHEVEFRYECSAAKEVYLAGDFNNWSFDCLPLQRNGDGIWTARVRLSPGRHEYRFIVDGDWQNDPHACGVIPNEFGSCNCTVDVV